MCICPRTTTTRIRRDTDEERKEQDPYWPRQNNLHVLISVCTSLQGDTWAFGCMDLLTRVRSCHFEVDGVIQDRYGTVPVLYRYTVR